MKTVTQHEKSFTATVHGTGNRTGVCQTAPGRLPFSIVAGTFGLMVLGAPGCAQNRPAAAGPGASANGAMPAKLSAPAESDAPRTAREVRGPASLFPIPNEPPAKLIVDPPLVAGLARGAAVIQYRTENLRIVPVFGAAALAVSPRIGHVHVMVDEGPWVWAHTSDEPLIVQGLAAGPHKMSLQLESPTHQLLDEGSVSFTVPALLPMDMRVASTADSATNEPPAKIFVQPPLPEALSRGVVFIKYRTENLQVVPVYGAAGLSVSPRIGHIHVTVDDASWHWADGSGNPVIINGLPPGPHKILIELANTIHQPIDRYTVQLTVPDARQLHDSH